MKQFIPSLRVSVDVRNVVFTIILTINGIFYPSAPVFAQQSEKQCWAGIPGQSAPIPCSTPKKKENCADGGPLIIKLNEATGYYERSIGYGHLSDNLKCRGLNIGFFGAASEVTGDLNKDKLGFSEAADRFLAQTSKDLVLLNAIEFKELADTGKLRNRDASGYMSTNPVDLDTELVVREQSIVEILLNKQGPNRYVIVSDINERIKWNLDHVRYLETPFSSTMSAIAKVRDTMREVDPNAEYNYGNIDHRIAVGYILAAQHRK